MGCLLGSHFTKSGCSTIYKMNRNFHYFSWHTCFYLATARREPAETEEALRGATGREAAAASPATSPHTSCVLSASWWPLPFSSARAIYSQHSPGEERPLCITCPRWCESSTEHCSHLRSHGAWHGEIAPCVIGWPPRWHGVTIMMAWGDHHDGMGLLPWGHPAASQPHMFPMPRGSLVVPGGPCQAPSHAKSQPSTGTGHFHPDPGTWERTSHPLVFSFSWQEQGRVRSTIQLESLDLNSFSCWIMTWHTHSAWRHWDFTFVSHICQVCQAAYCHQAPTCRKDGAPKHKYIFVQHVHFCVIFQSSLLGGKSHFKDD